MFEKLKLRRKIRKLKIQIEELEKKGRAYINGVPYPIKVNGSFMFFGLDRNPQKRAILKTIDKFN